MRVTSHAGGACQGRARAVTNVGRFTTNRCSCHSRNHIRAGRSDGMSAEVNSDGLVLTVPLIPP